jgi:hypothetical protein
MVGPAYYPWWEVTLPSKTTVTYVRVLNRGDPCCSFNLNKFTVSVDGCVCATDVIVAPGEWSNVPCHLSGSHVKVSLPRVDVMSMCGIEVYGFEASTASMLRLN